MSGRPLIKNLCFVLVVLIAAIGLIRAVGLVNTKPFAEPATAGYSSAGQLLDQLQNAVRQGGIIELEDAEINSLLGLYVERYGGTIKGQMFDLAPINIKLGTEDLTIHSSLLYKERINFDFTAQGRLDVQGDHVVFSPTTFKLGHILLPQKIVLNKLSGYPVISVEDEKIMIPKKYFPGRLERIQINNGKMIIEFQG